MNQLEIQFFWPLTEQIPLELDYTNCEKPKLYTNLATTGLCILNTGSTWSTQIVGNFSIDADEITFRTSKKPNIFRKMLFNVLGIKLEKR